MILLTALRIIYSAWIDARAMEREALKRYPHLRGG